MHVFRRRGFALLTLGVAIDAIGSWATIVALWGYAAYKFDAGPGQIALLGLAWALPAALLGPLAGVPIDRLGPRRVLIAAELAGAGAALALLTAHTWHQLVALGVLTGAVHAFSIPAADALPRRLVDDDELLAANAVIGAASDSAIVFGPVVAAVAIAAAGIRGAFVVDACTYLIGIAAVIPLRLRKRAPISPQHRHSVITEVRRGLGAVRQTPVVRWTLLLCLFVYLSWGTFIIFEPLYARDVLHASATTFALFQAAYGAALVLTGLVLPRFGPRVATTGFVAASVVVSGLAAVLYVGTHSVVAAYLGVALWGVDVAFFSAPTRTLLQMHTPVELHGRVLALNRTIENVGDVVALPFAGLAAAAVGVQGAALAIAGLAIIAGGAGLFWRPRPVSAPGFRQAPQEAATAQAPT